MDDGYTKDELFGVALLAAHEYVEKLKIDDKPLAPKFMGQLANKAAKAVVSGNLDGMVDPMAIGGEKLYEKDKFRQAVHVETSASVEKHTAAKTLVFRDAATSKYKVDIYCDQGRRSQMEDRHVAFEDLNALLDVQDADAPEQAFFGVYDGHGGVDAANYTAAQLHLQVTSQEAFKTDPAAGLRAGFKATDVAFLKKAEREALTSGATACAVLMRPKKLYISWLGDSQAMMCRGGKEVELMVPHKPSNEDEKKRIEDNGGVVVWYGAWRVNGILSVARAIGDKKLKQWVIGDPDVGEFDLDGSEEFMLIACDGLWDVMDSEKIIAFVKEWQSKNEGVAGVSQALVAHCIDDLSSSDNISCIVVFL